MMRHTRNVLFACLIVLVSRGYISAQEKVVTLNANEIITSLRESNAAIENMSIVATWTEIESGTIKNTETQRYVVDSLGRSRLESKLNVNRDDGIIQEEVDLIYDGEKNVYYSATPQNGSTYKHVAVITADAGNPVTYSRRNPLDYIRNNLLSHLEALSSHLDTIKVSNSDDLVLVKYALPIEESESQLQYSALLDPSKSWTLVKLETSNSAGALLNTTECTVAQSDSGIWVPERIQWKSASLDAQGSPKIAWNCEVHDVLVNDTSITDASFQRLFPVGTHISDSRFGVTYEIGADTAASSQISDLSQEALKKKHEENTNRRPRPAQINEQSSQFGVSRTLIIANALALVAICVVLAIRKSKGT